jgi:hypothetical protein
MHAQRAPDETRQRVRREAWTWALTLSLLAVALLWWGLASRANLQQRERDRLAGQARAVELNLARNVEGVHAALRFLRDEAASLAGRAAGGHALGGPMQALRDAMPGVQALLWLDANGRVLASSQAALVGTDLERVPFYSALRDQPDPALLVISGPQPEGAQGPVLNLALVVPPASAGFRGCPGGQAGRELSSAPCWIRCAMPTTCRPTSCMQVARCWSPARRRPGPQPGPTGYTVHAAPRKRPAGVRAAWPDAGAGRGSPGRPAQLQAHHGADGRVGALGQPRTG